jgi:hypothetical protein
MNPRLFTFVGGNNGPWTVVRFKVVTGESIPEPKKVEVINGPVSVLPVVAQWALKGVTSNARGRRWRSRRRRCGRGVP